jgi:hypothetical protein
VVWKCYSATTSVKPMDFHLRSATKVLQRCYKVLQGATIEGELGSQLHSRSTEWGRAVPTPIRKLPKLNGSSEADEMA